MSLAQENRPDYIAPQPESKEVRKKKSKRAGIIGGVAVTAAAAVTAGVVFLGGSGNSVDAAPRPSGDSGTSTSESATPTETAPAQSLETLDTDATPETIAEALQPISVAEYPTAQEALVRLGQVSNVLINSGENDLDTGTLTPESRSTGNQLLQIIYGPNFDLPEYQSFIADQLQYNADRDNLSDFARMQGGNLRQSIQFIPLTEGIDVGDSSVSIEGQVMSQGNFDEYFELGKYDAWNTTSNAEFILGISPEGNWYLSQINRE